MGSPRSGSCLTEPARAAGPGRATGAASPRLEFLLRRSGNQPLADRLLARSLAGAPHRFTFFPRRLGRRLLVEAALLHLAKHAFALHLLLQDAKSLVDIVVADEDLQLFIPSCCDGVPSARIGGRKRRSTWTTADIAPMP